LNNGLYKAGAIHRRGPSRSFEGVEYATLEWVDRLNNRRLLAASATSPWLYDLTAALFDENVPRQTGAV
jgi:hypothetical protein